MTIDIAKERKEKWLSLVDRALIASGKKTLGQRRLFSSLVGLASLATANKRVWNEKGETNLYVDIAAFLKTLPGITPSDDILKMMDMRSTGVAYACDYIEDLLL